MDKGYGQPSKAQGTAFFGLWRFTSAFDGGNGLWSSWSCNGREAHCCPVGTDVASAAAAAAKEGSGVEVETISVAVARDCHGEPRWQNPHAFWFHFGITPPPQNCSAEVQIIVNGVQQQRDLFAKCYRPWVSEPSCRRWRRVDMDAEATAMKGGWQVTWRHQFDGAKGTTFFAFCHPYSYKELQAWLDRLQNDFPQKAPPAPREKLFEEEVAFLQRFELCPSDVASVTADEVLAEEVSDDEEQDSGPLAAEVYFFESRSWHDTAPRAGRGVYFHRQALAFTPRGRRVELLTVTAAPSGGEQQEREELPESVVIAMRKRCEGATLEAPALSFPSRPVVFFSARVHPGETPGSFAINGLLQFILSDDLRAAELRKRFVFKVCPMLNPDGVAWGHSRFNTLGHDLNRCYRSPTPEQHEGVYAVKQLLLAWASRGRLLFYLDSHGHMNKRGCFLFGNHNGDRDWSSEDALVWNLAYAHAAQLNSPHLDIDNCEWSRHFDKRKGKDRGGEECRDGDDEADETSRAESGRAQIGECCRLYHAYTLECNYNTGRTVRPIADAPGLPPEAQAAQSLDGCTYEGRRILPMPYSPREWASVGEALAVALLDLHCCSAHSRLLTARPPKPFLPPARELAVASDALDRLWDALQARHAGTVPDAAPPQEREAPGLRRRLFKVVHSPHVYMRAKPDKAGTALGTKKPGDKVAVLEVRTDGWVRLCPSEHAKLTRKSVTEAYMLVDGTALGLRTLLSDSGESIIVPYSAEGVVPAQLASSIEDVESGRYPPPMAT